MKVLLHYNVDLDAILASFIFYKVTGQFLTFTFDANDPTIDVAIDCNSKHALWVFDHHDCNTFNSAAEALVKFIENKTDIPPEELHAARKFAEVANISDNSPHLVKFDAGWIGTLLRGVKAIKHNDFGTIAFMWDILEYLWYALKLEYMKMVELQSKIESGTIKFEKVNKYKIAIITDSCSYADKLYENYSVDFIILKDDFNMLIMRNSRLNIPLLGLYPHLKKAVADEIEEWFFHPRGFIVCRGTRKFPATSPSKLSFEDFIDICRTYIRTLR